VSRRRRRRALSRTVRAGLEPLAVLAGSFVVVFALAVVLGRIPT
jgi:hypothetical protein